MVDHKDGRMAVFVMLGLGLAACDGVIGDGAELGSGPQGDVTLPYGDATSESAIVSNCSSWETGTISGYNALSSDNSHRAAFEDYEKISREFLAHVPVVSIHKSDWEDDRYRNIQVRYKGTTATLQSWDLCLDADCDGCCSENKRRYAKPGYLLDIESMTARRLFDVENAENNLLAKIEYRICNRFDPAPIARRYDAEKN